MNFTLIRISIFFILLLAGLDSAAQFKIKEKKKVEPKSKQQPSNNVVKNTIKSKAIDLYSGDIRKIDTLLQPASVVTKIDQDNVASELLYLDLLDGQVDEKIHNLKGHSVDSAITILIYQAAKKTAIYIENETFDDNPNLNVSKKKLYLNTIAKQLRSISKGLNGKKSFDISTYYDIMPTITDFSYAIKNKQEQKFVQQSTAKSLFFLREMLPFNDSLKKQIVSKTCDNYPELIGNNLDDVLQYEGYCNVVNYLAKNRANLILSYLTSTSPMADKIAACDNDLMPTLKEIAKTKNHLRAVSFLGPLSRKEMKIEEVEKICSDTSTYFNAIITLNQKREALSENVIKRDLVDISKVYVQKINGLHEASDNVRFASVSKMSATELYYLMVMTGDEIYTSSFLGLYSRFMAKMAPLKGDEFLQSIKMDKFRTFIRMCANYNTLADFLKSVHPEMRNSLLSEFVRGLADNKKADMEGAVDVADSFGSIADTTVMKFLVGELDKELALNKQSNNDDGVKIYYILSNLAQRIIDPKKPQPADMPVIDQSPLKVLLEKNKGEIVEQMFFYGDPDGIGCFNGFIGQFRNKDWKVVDQAYWVELHAVNTKVPFTIYCNKPLKEPMDEQAQQFLKMHLEEKNINPSIIVHRGHSYHLPHTIKQIDNDVSITILGSCGGYHNLTNIVQRSPETQIISTKQIGSGSVNGPLLRIFHKEITSGNDINWPKIWVLLEKQMTGASQKALFEDYVPPFKNMGAIFLATFDKLQ